jgi:hypothetical protein
LAQNLAENDDANFVELAAKLSDFCGIALIPVLMAESQFGLLIVF